MSNSIDSNSKKTALVIGSSGLIGSHLVIQLLSNPNFEKVIVFNRRACLLLHPKIEEYLIDFNNLKAIEPFVKGDVMFCTMGTTIKKAGSKEAFRLVDVVYPEQFTEMALHNQVKQFLIISSLGADLHSNNFYLKTKGEIETFLQNSAFKSVSILRPSLLLGDRKEFRLGEKIASYVLPVLSLFLIGPFKKYRAIEAKTVAKAMLEIALQNKSGFNIYQSDELQTIGNK
jgi:uncharacterized protein YbjT (DUF2867 family)